MIHHVFLRADELYLDYIVKMDYIVMIMHYTLNMFQMFKRSIICNINDFFKAKYFEILYFGHFNVSKKCPVMEKLDISKTIYRGFLSMNIFLIDTSL